MFRHLALRIGLLALVACAAVPSPARASGAWSTFIRMTTCNDLLAQRDTVWLASNEAGLLRYIRSRDVFESITREPNGLASNSVLSIAYDRSGRLWAGTAGKGASRLSTAGNWDLVNAFDGLPSDSVNVLRADGDTIWVGTTRGVALWNGSLIAGSVPDLGTASPFRSNNVTGIVVAGDSLFVGTDDGVYIARLSESLRKWDSGDGGLHSTGIVRLGYDGAQVYALAYGSVYTWPRGATTWSYTPVLNTYVKNLRDDNGVILASSQDSLCVLSGGAWHAVAGAPTCDGTVAGDVELGADPDGRVFAVRAGNLRMQRPGTWATKVPPGPVGNNAQNVLFDGKNTWVATFDAGVSRFDGTTWRNWPGGCCGSNQDTSFMEPSFAFTLQRDRSGYIWVSNWASGIERIQQETTPMHFDHIYNCRGIPDGDSLVRHSDMWSSCVDSLGYVYIGGDTDALGSLDPIGIDVYDTSGTRVITWKTTNADLRGNQVRALAVDHRGQIWAGFALGGVRWAPLSTTNSAVNVEDRRKLPSLTPVSGLEGKPNFGVVAHGDSIWVLTTSDLNRVRANDHSFATTLDTPAGLPPRGAVHPLDVAVDGTVWVASTNGIRTYSPGGATEDFRMDNSPLADNEVRAVFVEPGSTAVWIATAGGVNRYDPHYRAPAPPRIPVLHVRPYPNPVLVNGLAVQLRLTGNAASYYGEVLDLGGRVVRRFGVTLNGGVVWDGRDGDGTVVRSGVYFIHAHGGGHEAMVRVVVLR